MLNLYHRHQPPCRFTTRRNRNCNCPIWVQGSLRGEYIRRGLNLRSWSAGTDLVRDWEAAGEIGVVTLASETHPSIARSIALAACRAVDPEGSARQYLKNYDQVLRLVRRTDPGIAHVVALQTCRSSDPMRWAKRFLKEQLQRVRSN